VRRWLGTPVARYRNDVVALGAVAAAAVLMVCSALIHIHLWDIAYRNVATLGPLFLVQAVAALVLAVVLVVTRVVVVALACMALMLGTLIGFVLAASVGIFGFTLTVVTGWAYEALLAELVSAVVLAVLVARAWQATRQEQREQQRQQLGASGGRDADHGLVEVPSAH
jgi:hypothetical protein